MKDIEYEKHGFEDVYNETITIPNDMVFIECAPGDTECHHYDGYNHYIGFSKDMSWVKEYERLKDYETGGGDKDEEVFQTDVHYEVLGDILIIILDNVIPITPLSVVSFEYVDKTFGISDLYFVKTIIKGFDVQGIYHIKRIFGTAGIVVDAVVKHNLGYNIMNNTVMYIGQIVNNERSDSLITVYRGKESGRIPKAFESAVRDVLDRVIS